MSTYLVTSTELAARALERKAWAYCLASLDCKGGNWSDIYVNQDGKQFAIIWSNELAGAFTPEELGTAGDPPTDANVIEDNMVNWTVVPVVEPATINS